MEHLAILPILIPLLCGVLMLLPPISGQLSRQRSLSLAALGVLVLITLRLLLQAGSDEIEVYVLGDWQPPYGIVLVADRLSTLMLLLSSVLGFASMLYACAGDDRQGAYFHPLFMFQLMGINGAFLTGDIFNLFVFFEVLLIASYALLIHGGGKQKTRASVHYVVLNLVGSSIFLFALGILYGTLGTLNIADLAQKVSQLAPSEQAIASAGALMLLVVFGLKSAILPLQFWLPRTYSAASAPVAALFAILTKVGIYSILRVFTVIFGDDAGALAQIATPWLWPLAILTLIAATIGVLAASSLRQLIAQLVVLSVGTLLVGLAMARSEATGALLYYLVHSTLVCAGLFLLADMISQQRGKAEDRFVAARRMCQPVAIGIAFFIGALAIVGLPPFSGFVGKALLLKSTLLEGEAAWVYPAILFGGLAALIAMSRAGTTLFWHTSREPDSCDRVSRLQLAAVFLLLLTSPLLVIFGGPVSDFTYDTAEQLHGMSRSLHLLLPGGGS
ncbi:monovalent cation/H+ antiporter subunit D [Marinobacterium zhoushanense]|uniref:Monovalent cation/H+ antiporter subunit D n=1 Tax=Marinobacterium zhoushanense TaxID=1679163 RepID=A0ABQ1KTV0_9GAMM|nr:monovalent cation/H+ antiporter subunit D [Marinobacterium zhoushanense]GGC07007.1 monovalent cation/H+ antiporter subunit D [Marinobacterium zhoushanense]